MSLRPKSYAEALEKARNRPVKPRAPLARKTPLKGNGAGKAKTQLQRLIRANRAISGGCRKAKKRPKKLTDGQLKKRVWREFSVFVRLRGADDQGFNVCVTCGTRRFWKDLQAGHFIRGRLNANLFDERGCNPQCYVCNIHFQGNVVIYYKWMLEHHGQEVIDALLVQNVGTKKWRGGELQALLDHYKAINEANPLASMTGD